MRYLFLEDFAHRRSQVRRYLAVVSRTEREVRLNGNRKLDTDRLHVLRAGTFLILYNLVEASARAALEAIYDAMSSERVPFSALNAGIRREVIKGFKRNADVDKHAEMVDVPVEFVSVSLDIEYHFSGNVDSRLIGKIAERYGFSSQTEYVMTQGGKDLKSVKDNRNDLAHGLVSYDEIGRKYTTRDLIGVVYRTILYVENILSNVADYLDAKGYKGT